MVPDYLTERDGSVCGRYFINADRANHYGTKDAFPSWLYPGEGNRFVPGNDLAHMWGAQADTAPESVQRVPMVFWTPGMSANPTNESFRTPDVLPTILAAMGISRTSPTDGKPHTLGR
jgi:arylsulfatase A-like enzyme